MAKKRKLTVPQIRKRIKSMRNAKRPKSMKEIGKKFGQSQSWVSQFLKGKIKNPLSKTIKRTRKRRTTKRRRR